jgi:ketosteroid isomerase-like protein
MAHPNEDLVRKGYAAFLGGDTATLSDLFADDIVWHSPGRNQLAGDFRGKEAVLGNFQRTFELTGGNINLEIHDVVANDDHVVVLVHTSAQKDGRKLEDDGIQLFHVTDGKVTEQWLYPGDPYASDEFWGQG